MKEGNIMIVILDSNIFISDFYMAGNNFNLFMDFLNRTDNELYVPRVVLLEVKNNFKGEMKKARDRIQGQMNGLKRRIGDIKLENPLTDNYIEQEFQLYSEEFDKKLKNIGAEILEHPNVSHQAIVERAIYNKKPFKLNGTGYRDTLIWESVIELLENQETSVALITRNIDDFCTKGNVYCIHDDLKADIINHEISGDKLYFYSDLKMFLKDFVLPQFDRQEELEEKILNREFPFENLDNIIYPRLSEILDDHYSEINDVYFEREFERPHLLQIYREGNLEVKDIRKISEIETYISMEMLSVATFGGIVRRSNFTQKSDYIHVHPSDDNTMYFEVTNNKIIKTSLNIIFSNHSNKIVSVEIENVEGG